MAIVGSRRYTPNGKIGKIDGKTLKGNEVVSANNGRPPAAHQIDSDGTIWLPNFEAGKLGQFDPKTETSGIFIAGPRRSPLRAGDRQKSRRLYSSEHLDVIGNRDPRPGTSPNILPQAENTMREFYLVAQDGCGSARPPITRLDTFT